MENLLTATNTFRFEDDGANNIYTCNCNGKYEPQQMDYILSSDNSLRSRTFDLSATKSDHWGLIAAIKSKHTKTPRKRLTENRLAGNVGITSVTTMKCMPFLNVDDGHFAQESRLCGEASFALYVFHGWFRSKNFVQRNVCWLGFTALKSYQNRDKVPMVEACGPVQIAEGGEKYYVGAIRARKNTAEMQALIEALFWLNMCGAT